ncbi:MAG: hypothetical protein ABIY50_04135 [Ignavibacteria bacterium]
MKNFISGATVFLLCLAFYSCESNDSPIITTTPPVVNVISNKVLVELFTNTSCIPCVDANQYLDAVHDLQGVTGNDTNVIILRMHTTLFAGDPFYLYNIPDNNARMTYYPNSAIVNPRTFLLGTFLGNFSTAPWTNKINEKLLLTRPVTVALSNSYNTSTRSGSLNVRIAQDAGSNFTGLVYHIAVAENDIQYTAPNGETHFSNTLRDLITPPEGQPFDIGSGQTNTYDQNYTIPGEVNQALTDLIVFVQVVSTREVIGVEKVKLQ